MTQAYYGSINRNLLEWVALDAGRVLELGCGEAALAAAYRRRNPRARYVAVEMEPQAAAVARTRVDRVFEGDFEAMDDAVLAAEGPFDVIVLGDVLEHLKDPWRALGRLRELLAPNGRLVACVPNIGHWSAVSHLLSGGWTYKDSGLFDRTHLRFFTLDSLRGMLKATGFRSVKLRPIKLRNTDAAERWVGALSKAVSELGMDAAAFADRSAAFQYLVCAERSDLAEKPVARVFMLALSPQFLDVRTRLPAAQLSSLPDLLVMYAEKAISLPKVPSSAPRVVIVQRPLEPDEATWLDRIARFVATGWLLVTELDDHPSLFQELGRDPHRGFELPLSAVHAVQTSTPKLAAELRARNPEVMAFDNALFDLPEWRERPPGPRTVFFGALNRERFSGRIAEALTPAIQAHPETEFVVMHDRAFFDALGTERKQLLPAAPYDGYLEAMSRCDIVLAPLEGSFGERFKSDIKFLEASGAGAATIASPTVYGETILDGETGLIAHELADWPAALSRLLGEPGLRDRMARAAWTYVRDERMFAYQTAARRDWYLSLWERREALTAGLLERHPALRGHMDRALAGSAA